MVSTPQRRRFDVLRLILGRLQQLNRTVLKHMGKPIRDTRPRSRNGLTPAEDWIRGTRQWIKNGNSNKSKWRRVRLLR